MDLRLASFLLLLVAGLAGCPAPRRPELTFSPDQLAEARVGESYRATITVSQNATPVGQIAVASGSLPTGLKLDHSAHSSVAEISGTPQAAERCTFTVSVWCYGTNATGQSGQKAYELVVR